MLELVLVFPAHRPVGRHDQVELLIDRVEADAVPADGPLEVHVPVLECALRLPEEPDRVARGGPQDRERVAGGEPLREDGLGDRDAHLATRLVDRIERRSSLRHP